MIRAMGITAVFLLAFGIATAPARPAQRSYTVKPDPLTWVLSAKVEISPAGRITALEWTHDGGDDARIAADIEPRVRAWRFEPGTIDGVPQSTTTHLRVSLRGEQKGDAVLIRIERASTGARLAAPVPPRYPMEAIRAGADAVLVANVAVDEAGRLTFESVDYRGNRAAYRSHFIKATKAAIEHWTFTPERVGGRAVATRMQIPVSFCVTRLDCEDRYRAELEAERPEGIGPMGSAIALESAVRLIDPLDRDAL